MFRIGSLLLLISIGFLRALVALVGAWDGALAHCWVVRVVYAEASEVLVCDLHLSKNVCRFYLLLLHHVLLARVRFKLVQILWPHIRGVIVRLLVHLIMRTGHHLGVILMLTITLLHPGLDRLKSCLGVEDADPIVLARSVRLHLVWLGLALYWCPCERLVCHLLTVRLRGGECSRRECGRTGLEGCR